MDLDLKKKIELTLSIQDIIVLIEALQVMRRQTGGGNKVISIVEQRLYKAMGL